AGAEAGVPALVHQAEAGAAAVDASAGRPLAVVVALARGGAGRRRAGIVARALGGGEDEDVRAGEAVGAGLAVDAVDAAEVGHGAGGIAQAVVGRAVAPVERISRFQLAELAERPTRVVDADLERVGRVGVFHADLPPLAVRIVGACAGEAGALGAEAAALLGLRVALAAVEATVGLAEADLAIAAVAVRAAARHAGGGAGVADVTLGALQIDRAARAPADAGGDVAELALAAVGVPLADSVRVAVAVAPGEGFAVFRITAGAIASAGTAAHRRVAVPVGSPVRLHALLVAVAARPENGVVFAGDRDEARDDGG